MKISASSLRTFSRCKREHHYGYVLGRRPITTTPALAFGTVFHHALEAWWTEPAQVRLDVARRVIAASELDEFERAKADALICGYDARWHEQRYTSVAAEVGFGYAINVGIEARVVGYIDAIARDADGELLLVEHKTTGDNVDDGAPYWLALSLDSQISIYHDGARAVGYEVTSCLYDVIRKPRIEPLSATPEGSRKFRKDGKLYVGQRDTDETADEYRSRLIADIALAPEWYFKRQKVTRRPEELERARLDLLQSAWIERICRETKTSPRNPDACRRYGTMCPYWDVCTGSADIDDDSRFYSK